MEKVIVLDNEVFFKPWIGPEYITGINGMKTMVLGESLWCCEPYTCQNPNCQNQAIEIIKKQIEDRSVNSKSENNPYYTKVSRLVYGAPFTRERKVEFWNRVAFYELIQVSVGKGSRIRPTIKMWEESKKPLYEVITVLEPDIIFIPGKELHHNFISKFDSTLIFSDNTTFFKYHIITFKGKNIKVFSFKHPSGGMTYKVRDKIHQFLKE